MEARVLDQRHARFGVVGVDLVRAVLCSADWHAADTGMYLVSQFVVFCEFDAPKPQIYCKVRFPPVHLVRNGIWLEDICMLCNTLSYSSE